MEDIGCIICGTQNHEIIQTQVAHDPYLELIQITDLEKPRAWCRCPNCKFVYSSPQLSSLEFEQLYSKFRDIGFRNETPDEYFDRIASIPDDESENYEKIVWISDRLDSSFFTSKSLSIYDIGCGGGVFLHRFKQRYPSAKASGIEPSKSFADLARRRCGATISPSFYNEKSCAKQYSLITCIQVLEHVLNPFSFLRTIKKDLLENGFFYLEVPDICDFQYLPKNHDRFQAQHLWYFSQDSLEVILNRCGFKYKAVDVVKTKRGRNNLVCLCTPN